tara:strand:+ start:454 stop:711 length:258 start_codon:yes stop_codon:yes gene_type:complete
MMSKEIEDKMMVNFVAMNIQDVGNEEADIIDYLEGGGDSNKLYKALNKIAKSKKWDPNEEGQYNSALAILIDDNPSIDEGKPKQR